MQKDKKILIVGLGLLGGSYAQSLTRQGYEVYAITRKQSTIDYALEHGMIKAGTTQIDEKMIADADIAVFALYPHIFIEWIEQNGKYFKKGAIITDVTGVKCGIVDKIQALLPEGVEFIGAHPMAGKEVYGIENSNEEMFKGANYIVTPTEKNSREAVEICKELGRMLGFGNVTELTPQKHDRMIGFLSQLTHCIAVALMTCNDDANLCKYTGDSFRDLTRIARINEDMWSELFMLNKDILISEMKAFGGELEKLRRAMETDDVETMKKMMRVSTERRAMFDKK
ncbi:MAG: prephenate dehydrogenase [Ruminococcaceae bacterium]|nr:prephenate dehydrogenase [Oscillospiraceae bacterium]